MIPLKLQIKNFLSYGPEFQIIDFEPHSLICLSGKNGHGKSAILDAITWALWGQARKISGTAKSDDALLRIGQTQMIIIFDFLCNRQGYRIRREYMKTYGKPITSVDFGLFDRQKDAFISLNDKTTRTTQSKIEKTIKLDFNAFINSAFLRQGQANEFSKKSPKERKEILSSILGLNSYETIRKLATEKARTAYLEKNSISSLQDKIEHELQSTNEVQQMLARLTKKLEALIQQEQNIIKQKEQLDKVRENLAEDKQKLRFFNLQLEQLIKEETKEKGKLHTIHTEWKTVHAKQLNMPDAHNLERKKKELEAVIYEHQKKQQQYLELKEKRLTCQTTLQKLTNELKENIQNSLQQKTMNLERLLIEQQHQEQLIKQLSSAKKERQEQLEKIKKELKKKSTILEDAKLKQENLPHLIKQFEKRKEHYQRFSWQASLIQQELHNLENKQKLSQDDSNPSCPLCEQNLSASRRKFLRQKFVKEEQFLRYRLSRLTKIIKSLKKVLIEQHETIENLTKEAEQRKAIQLEHEELVKKKNDIQSLLQSLDDQISSEQKKLKLKTTEHAEAQKQLEKQKKQSSSILEGNSSLQQQKKELANYDRLLETIPYQPQKHTAAQKELKEVEEKINKYQHDLEQITLQDKRKQKIHELCQSLKKYKKNKQTIKQNQTPFMGLEKREKELNIKDRDVVTQLSELSKQKEKLLQEKGRLEQQNNKRVQLEQEHIQYKKQINKFNETINDYHAIAMATGKDGIQALLIQDIIPEIEQEANMLLAKLTDNQAQIFIESLRDLKKGGTKETLDIKISDTIGIRPYELFSGGEAFRIDFALRIAISKLLARRAGTALQTLIIDEGFSSQDEDGLANIMDAIYKIQDDFAKIIIVSHLPALKESFPVHFFVEKGAQGSKIITLEQG